jgi:ADP-heptose:LPS heptosyltransferase
MTASQLSSPAGRILIIKLGALGDFVQALGPMAAIRNHHRDVHLTLLTTKPYAAMALQTDLIDDVWLDARPAWYRPGEWMSLRRRLREAQFEWVYDLQTSDRSSFYYRLFWPGPYPKWSGIAKGCSHPHANPERDFMHTVDRQREQLHMADLSWAQADTAGLGITGPYALLVPGGAAHRPGKRWPAEQYGTLAQWLAARSIQPVIIGTSLESDVLDQIASACPDALDLRDRTDFPAITALAGKAVCAVGNDTGPMHLITAAGCPTLVLYSYDSDPALCGQRGPAVVMLRQDSLADITTDTIIEALKRRVPALA